jgi:hypothetical protein
VTAEAAVAADGALSELPCFSCGFHFAS